MKVLAAVLVTATVLAGAAVASNRGVTPAQVTALNKRVTALEHRTATLEKSNAALTTYVDTCLKAFTGVTEYGGSEDGSGYVYLDATAHDTLYVTALDLTAPGDASAYWFLSAPASCAARR